MEQQQDPQFGDASQQTTPPLRRNRAALRAAARKEAKLLGSKKLSVVPARAGEAEHTPEDEGDR